MTIDGSCTPNLASCKFIEPSEIFSFIFRLQVINEYRSAEARCVTRILRKTNFEGIYYHF